MQHTFSHLGVGSVHNNAGGGENAHLLCALGGGIPEVVDMACRVLKKNT